MTKAAINHAWGVAVAGVTLIIVGNVAGSVPVTSAIVGLSVVVLVLGAHLPALATIPAAVYGYAATAAFCLMGGVAIADTAATGKAAAMVLVSLVIGNLFGLLSERLGGALARPAT